MRTVTLKLSINEDGSVMCGGTYKGSSGMNDIHSNLMIIGAIEIAKESLLRGRWKLIDEEGK